nr:unnamed protein product [Callosobruchus analis]
MARKVQLSFCHRRHRLHAYPHL